MKIYCYYYYYLKNFALMISVILKTVNGWLNSQNVERNKPLMMVG